MGQADRDLLIEMGFEPRRVELALKSTGGLQDAISWLDTHQDTSLASLEDPSINEASSSKISETDITEETKEAKSYKCNDCGKLLRNWDAVQFHAERTEHQNFDESTEVIKPLTEEEKKQKLEDLKAKLAEKRKNQQAEALLDNKKNEAIRRKRDQESERAKEELRKKEQLRDVERRKQEKLDDARAKAKIKAEIAATQQARREAATRAKAEREGKVLTENTMPTVVSTSGSSKTSNAHNEARLRFQIVGRAPITKIFPANTSLFEVASELSAEGVVAHTLTTTFPPRRRYNLQEPLDSGLTLKEANLTPSASLLVE